MPTLFSCTHTKPGQGWIFFRSRSLICSFHDRSIEHWIWTRQVVQQWLQSLKTSDSFKRFWVGRRRIYPGGPHRQWNLFMVIAAGAWHRMLLIITRLGADPTWPFSLHNLHQPCTNCYEVDMRIIVCNYPGTDTQHPQYWPLLIKNQFWPTKFKLFWT